MTVAYDGTDFHGWQRQVGLRTVQGELEQALTKVLGGEPVTVNGAGRTDAGVHARGQVASFRAGTNLPARAVAALAGRELPGDVRLVEAREADETFHARHSARARRYAYRLLESDDLLLGRFAWWPMKPLDGEALNRAVAPLIGRHDCRAFEAAGSSPVRPECDVRLARWERCEGGWRFEVKADHFLYHMVRNVVATALRAASLADPAAHMAEVLASHDRARGAGTAPARGLCLEEVEYGNEGGLAA
ncbi:MAG: tRNA pseudouridine(38-40) synthase TruA [Candidatus Eisenbacteria bacterium]|nr:tRNA pseudouridine(38-40) synthase TruA [Candidatus Eisenbacteria bacterium]